MDYLLVFLEGIITFISPCLLPMIPLYIFYFAGEEGDTKNTLKNALGFVLGFTLVFSLMGAFAGVVGSLLTRYQKIVNIVAGAVVILFGLNHMGILKIGFLSKSGGSTKKVNITGFFSAVLFGIMFSISWTPCVSAFLGSALMLASQKGSALQGIIMLLLYSAGLGIPFILSALLINRLKSAFDWIKRNYKTINIVSGLFLVVMGIFMATGHLGKLLNALSF